MGWMDLFFIKSFLSWFCCLFLFCVSQISRMICLVSYSIVLEAYCGPVWGAAVWKKDAEGTLCCAPSQSPGNLGAGADRDPVDSSERV